MKRQSFVRETSLWCYLLSEEFEPDEDEFEEEPESLDDDLLSPAGFSSA
jgi:hypothetical protein